MRFCILIFAFLLLCASALPAPVFAQQNQCTCFCASNEIGAWEPSDRTMTPAACQELCEGNDNRLLICATDKSQYPNHNLRCWDRSTCEQTFKGADGKEVRGEWDAGYQPPECLEDQHYCYARGEAYKLAVPFGDTITVLDLGDYVGKLYTFLLGFSITVAIVMIMIGGLQYVLGAASSDQVEKAKSRIQHAVIGLILLFAASLLLQTVNPRLISLQSPTLPMVRRQEFGGNVNGECPNEAKFKGKFECGKNYSGEDDPALAGSCIGQHCSGGKTCIVSGGKYGCLDKSVCPSRCQDIDSLGATTRRSLDDLGPLRLYCESDLCKEEIPSLCRIESTQTYGNTELIKCVPRKVDGESCSGDADCYPGFFCNPGEIPNTCRERNGLAGGVSCDEDSHCASGICNKGYWNDVCAPVGGSPEGAPCKRDKDCGAPTSNRVCNDEYEPDVCSTLGSLRAGAECDRPEVCRSGRCDEDEECE